MNSQPDKEKQEDEMIETIVNQRDKKKIEKKNNVNLENIQEYLNSQDTLTFERKKEIVDSIRKIHRKLNDRSDHEKNFIEK